MFCTWVGQPEVVCFPPRGSLLGDYRLRPQGWPATLQTLHLLRSVYHRLVQSVLSASR